VVRYPARLQAEQSATGIAVRAAIALVAACCVAPAFADDWHGEDKVMHGVLIGGLSSFIVTVQTKSPWAGFATGAAFGVGKELIDASMKNGTGFSGKDLAWTLVGSALGAATGHWMVSREGQTTVVSYVTRF
jgi:uncharacterized protein YfiM (DUF2279 family)